MNSDRKELFRYEFKEPICATFRIKLEKVEEISKFGESIIINLSPKGLQMWSGLDIPLGGKNFIIEIMFTLNEKLLIYKSKLIWKNSDYKRGAYYGLEFIESDVEQNNVLELKKYTKRLAGMRDR